MTNAFWLKVKKWVDKQVRQTHLAEKYVDLKCQVCNTWSSLASSPLTPVKSTHPVAVTYKCGQCGGHSSWVCEAGFWFPATKLGITKEEIDRSITISPVKAPE